MSLLAVDHGSVALLVKLGRLIVQFAKGKALLVLVDQDTTGTLTPVAQQFSA